MNENSTNYDDKLFRQDLKIYTDAIKENDFKTANILSNRIMSNSWFFNKIFYGISGFVLRQLALDALIASNINENSVSSIKEQIKAFTDSLLGQISSKKNNLTEMWTYFSIAYEKNRKEFLPHDEKSTYTNEVEFTHNVFIRILEILDKTKDQLSYPSNNLLKGILNEINRVARTYGIKKEDLLILELIVMLDRIDEYVGVTAINKKDFEHRIKVEIIPIIEKFLDIVKNEMNEKDCNEFLWSLIGIWRENFVRFMEPRPMVQQQKKNLIDEEIKEEMVDEFIEGIGGELIKK